MLSKEERATLRHNNALGSGIGNRVVVNDLLDTCDELEKQLVEAEAAGAAMREALEFYADPQTWHQFEAGGRSDRYLTTEAERDSGHRATMAISPSKGVTVES